MTLPSRIALALMLGCALVLHAAHAPCVHAQEADDDSLAPDSTTERARVHFRNGVDFYHEGNFRAALIEFKRAYNASPHYKLLYNLGQASLELQEDGQAIDYFTSYLQKGQGELSPERRREVELEIQRLQARLAHATITTDEPGVEIYVDGGLVGKTPLAEPLKLSVGRRRISAVKAGFVSVERTFDVASGDQLTLDFEMKSRSSESPSAPQLARSTSSGMSAAAWTGIATGVLGAGAITLSILTGVAQTDFDKERQRQTSAVQLQDMRDDAKLKALGADIAWGATIIAAGVTGVLLFTNSGPERAPADNKQSVKLDVGAGSLHVRGRF